MSTSSTTSKSTNKRLQSSMWLPVDRNYTYLEVEIDHSLLLFLEVMLALPRYNSPLAANEMTGLFVESNFTPDIEYQLQSIFHVSSSANTCSLILYTGQTISPQSSFARDAQINHVKRVTLAFRWLALSIDRAVLAEVCRDIVGRSVRQDGAM